MLLVVLCGSLLAYTLLCLRRHIRANARGIPFAPYASGGAGLGMFSRLHLLVTFVDVVIVVLFVVWRSAACNILALVFRRPLRLLLLVHVWFFCFFFLFALYFTLVVCGPLRAFLISFVHPSCPFIPFSFSAAVAVLLCLRQLACTGILFVPYVCGVRGWAWRLRDIPYFACGGWVV